MIFYYYSIKKKIIWKTFRCGLSSWCDGPSEVVRKRGTAGVREDINKDNPLFPQERGQLCSFDNDQVLRQEHGSVASRPFTHRPKDKPSGIQINRLAYETSQGSNISNNSKNI